MRAGVHQVVTFATEVFRGNPAFAVSLERETPDAVLQKVAAQLNEPVLASLRPLSATHHEVLFHTPEGRHPGAGHAMLAAAHVVLAREGAGNEAVFVLSDGSECRVWRDGSRIAVPWPLMPGLQDDMADSLEAALGKRPVETLDSSFGHVAVYDDPESVATMQPDMQALSRLPRGVTIVTAPGDRSDIVLRAFAPRLGLPEDPVCGTAHRIIVPYWADRLSAIEIHSRQLSPRGGDLWCSLGEANIVIAGDSRIFLSGSVELPD